MFHHYSHQPYTSLQWFQFVLDNIILRHVPLEEELFWLEEERFWLEEVLDHNLFELV
jgi:hypothetical protein